MLAALLGPDRTYGTLGGAASGSFGHVFDDQHRRLVGIVVAKADDAQHLPADGA